MPVPKSRPGDGRDSLMVSLVVEEDAVVLMVVFQDLERALLGLRACPWGLKIKPTPSEEHSVLLQSTAGSGLEFWLLVSSSEAIVLACSDGLGTFQHTYAPHLSLLCLDLQLT